MAEILATGARVKFLRDGDVAGAILAADETSTVDACVGIGGTPEGVIAACALRCLDGQILGRLYPRDDGERVGSGVPPEVDLAVDPVDGTTLTAKSLPDAIAVIAIAERGTMFDPGPCVYMEKLAVAGDVADVVELDATIADNLRRIAERRGKRADDITVAVLERPRHDELVKEILATGARVKFLRDGDVAGAILAADETSTVDACIGIGGTPEGVIAACALRCMDGQILGRLYPRDDAERNAALERGYDLERVLRTEDLVSGQDIFFAATGVTGGELLQGVRYGARRIITQSLSMRSKSGAVRIVEGRHHPERSNLIRVGSTAP